MPLFYYNIIGNVYHIFSITNIGSTTALMRHPSESGPVYHYESSETFDKTLARIITSVMFQLFIFTLFITYDTIHSSVRVFAVLMSIAEYIFHLSF